MRFVVYFLLTTISLTATTMWYIGSHTLLTFDVSSLAIAFGRLAGLYAQLLLLLQVLLVARIPYIEHAFGYDRMNLVHRYVGSGVLLFLVAHPLLLAYGHATVNDTTLSEQFSQFVLHWPYVGLAFFAIVIFLLIGFTSWHIVRHHSRYEWWYGVHLLTYAALVASFLHQPILGTMHNSYPWLTFWVGLFLLTIALFLLFRWGYPLYLTYKHAFRVESIVKEGSDVVSIYISGRRMEGYRFEAGQFTSWRFHHGSLLSQIRSGFLFPHPFSFSQAYNGKNIRLSAKGLGDFTKQLPELTVGTRVTVAAPMGRFTLARSHQNKAGVKKILCIAGGIGITPMRAMLEEACAQRSSGVLLYGARTRNDLALLEECTRYAEKIVCCLSNESIVYAGEYASPITKDIIEKEVLDILERDVYICGPKRMMDAMTLAVHDLGVPESHIHYEEFSY
jgi:predicted ferric reductase